MILGFKTKFPWGEPTFFWQKVLASALPQYQKLVDPKLHTIREGGRWKAGDWLHMATGVRTKQYAQFNRGIEPLAKCRATQRFDLTFRSGDCVALYIDKTLMYCKNKDHLYEITPGWMDQFVKNDGFDNKEQFFRWFTKSCRNFQLIHWTDLKY